jgi:hypothetical protein
MRPADARVLLEELPDSGLSMIGQLIMIGFDAKMA